MHKHRISYIGRSVDSAVEYRRDSICIQIIWNTDYEQKIEIEK